MFKDPVKNASITLFAVMIAFMLTNVLSLPETYVWLYRFSILIVLFATLKRLIKNHSSDKWGIILSSLFMGWMVIGFFRAVLVAEGYWMWKHIMINLTVSLFYIVIIISTNFEVILGYYRLYWKFFIPLVLLAFYFDGTPLLLNYVPFLTLMLFWGLIPRTKRWLLLGIVVMFFVTNIQRNDLIKILVGSSIGLSVSYYYFIMPRWGFRFFHLVLLSAPFVLVWLGVNDIFNIFKMDEYITGDFTQEITTAEGLEEENLKGDTRTFIYVNVFATMNNHNAWILGRSPAYGDEGIDDFWGIDEITGLAGRYGNEVGVLDILLWYGLIGVFIYFLIYFRASYLAIYKSRNRYAKAVGIYVAFLWTWAFVWEKPLFETFFMMDLVLIGLCFSDNFRHFTDDELELKIRSIFVKKPENKFNNYRHENSVVIKRSVS